MIKLQKRVSDKEIVVSISDKSKKTVVMDIELYQEVAKVHTDKDTLTDWKTVKKIERQANDHAKMMSKIMNIGTGIIDRERWDIAFKVVDSKPPVTVFNMKDHKMIPIGGKCPASRKVCNAKDGPLSRIEYMSGLWLNTIAEEERSPNECLNTENMKREMSEVNKVDLVEDRERIVMSIDIENMYPSMDKEIVKTEVFKLIMKTTVTINNLNWKMLTIFLLNKIPMDRLKKMGLVSLIPSRNQGTKINI